MIEFLDNLPDWVPDVLSSLDSLLAILLALAVIVGVVTKLPSRIWRRTRFHRRHVQTKALDQLAIGRPLQTVESVLGHAHLLSRSYKGENAWVEERIYRLPGAWVTIQAPEGAIEVYSITITDRKLYYDTGPATFGIVPIRLGRDSFADALPSESEAMEIYARLATFVRFYDFISTAAGGQYLWLAFNGVGAGKFDGGFEQFRSGRYTDNNHGGAEGTPPDRSKITVNTLTVAGGGYIEHLLHRGVHGPHPDEIRRG